MNRTASTRLLGSLMVIACLGGTALAQNNPLPPADSGNPGSPGPSSLNQAPDINLGPDAPAPLTGELVPLPGPPPEGQAAKIKLPDCAPPNCGVPEIMAP
ncbi:hypothetical protein MWN33_13670 [Starkeya koreensis]|uniref:Uncharacterized protein n=1 Tax=Ancylobacter koreensis TaxID=266121 RepID=A0ABT0DPF8_9HYPH|nr:hypothetical protein [Ancylobacter koreensis]MCK0209079.1 hypothetical protein [Ancylobacter koreensis]